MRTASLPAAGWAPISAGAGRAARCRQGPADPRESGGSRSSSCHPLLIARLLSGSFLSSQASGLARTFSTSPPSLPQVPGSLASDLERAVVSRALPPKPRCPPDDPKGTSRRKRRPRREGGPILPAAALPLPERCPGLPLSLSSRILAHALALCIFISRVVRATLGRNADGCVPHYS